MGKGFSRYNKNVYLGKRIGNKFLAKKEQVFYNIK